MLRREQLAEFSRRTRQVLLLAGLTGAITGLVVAGFERLTADVILKAVFNAPLGLQAVAPGVGLVVAVTCLRYAGRRATPATSDDYIRAFHDPAGRLSIRMVPVRMAAAIATLGPAVRWATRARPCTLAPRSARVCNAAFPGCSDRTTPRCSWWPAPPLESPPSSRHR